MRRNKAAVFHRAHIMGCQRSRGLGWEDRDAAAAPFCAATARRELAKTEASWKLAMLAAAAAPCRLPADGRMRHEI